MSIPLDRLYHYLENLCNDDIIIYRASPHGSKKLSDLTPLKPFKDYPNLKHCLSRPVLVAHDQEPLDYDYYEKQGHPGFWGVARYTNAHYMNALSDVPNLRRHLLMTNIYDKQLLCHSEKNSAELEKFNSYYIGVYYWSHAIIARDWFRFAEHDSSLTYIPNDYKHTFLIYNRAWSGTREYRLKFVDLLVSNNLLNSCLTSFSPIDSGIHYTQHKFKNQDFTISNTCLEQGIPENNSPSSASADYQSIDYVTCGIEVVLETLFDDSRHHLTEKTLRPIACAKPFILLATPGSLQYLRDYGFKTFNGLIDETYDTIQNSKQRLECIVAEMLRINSLPMPERLNVFHQLNNIARYNQKLFFSKKWQQKIASEFVLNYKSGLEDLKKSKSGRIWKTLRPIILQHPDLYTDAFLQYNIGNTMDQLIETIDSITV